VVRVVADQYSWNVHYAGADGQFGRVDMALVAADNPLGLDRRDPLAKDDLTFINQMTVPVNRPVLVRLSSKDVIHSFGINEMRVKQDASPGFDTPVWFVPTVTTADMRQRLGRPDFQYEVACSQLCGLGHFRMRAFLNVVTAAEYQAFLDEEARGLTR
jgi:cytochrome c oxidase subunit 2